MTIAVQGAATTADHITAAATTILAVPAGAAVGEVLVAQVTTGAGGAAITGPAGWTTIQTGADYTGNPSDAVMWVGYHIVTASEPASYSWSYTSTTYAMGTCWRLSGVDTTAPVRTSALAQYSTRTGTMAAPALTGVQPGDAELYFWGYGDDAGSNQVAPTSLGGAWTNIVSRVSTDNVKCSYAVIGQGALAAPTLTTNDANDIGVGVGVAFTGAVRRNTVIRATGFEGGSSGAALSTSNTDGAFTTVSTPGTGASATFATGAYDGSLCAALAAGSSTSGNKVTLACGYGSMAAANVQARFYVKLSTLPASASQFLQVTNSGGTAIDLFLNASGTVGVQDTAGTLATTSYALTAGTWYRIELWATTTGGGAGTGTVHMGIAQGEGPILATVDSTAANLGTVANFSQVNVGALSGNWSSGTIYVDDFAVGQGTTFLGPALSPAFLRAYSTAGDAATANASSLSLTIPAAAQIGDTAVLTLSAAGNQTLTTPTGWTLVNQTGTSGSSASGWLLTKTIASGDAGSTVTLTWSATCRPLATCKVYGGVTLTGAVLATTNVTTTGTSFTLPTASSVPAGAMVDATIIGRAGSATATVGAPTVGGSYTAIGTTLSTNISTSPEVWQTDLYEVTAGGGSVGGETVTATQTSTAVLYTYALPLANPGVWVDSASPAGVEAAAANPVTASFTPGVGTILVAAIMADGTSTAEHPTISMATGSGGAGTWTAIKESTGNANGGYAGLWWAPVTSPQPMSVQVAMTNTPTMAVKVYVLNGADTTTPAAVTGGGAFATQNPSLSVTNGARAQGLLIDALMDWNGVGTPTSSTLTGTYTGNVSGAISWGTGTELAAAASTAYAASWTCGASGAQGQHVAAIVQPVAPASSVYSGSGGLSGSGSLSTSARKFATLTDDFSASTANWTLVGGSTISGGKLNVPQSTGFSAYAVTSQSTWDLTGSSVYVQLGPETNTTTAWDTYFNCQMTGQSGANGALRYDVTGGNLVAQWTNAGGANTYSVAASVAYNPATMNWLRFRESGGTAYWDYSGDGKTWTNLGSASTTLTLTSVQVVLGVGGASTGTQTFDNFNTLGTVTGTASLSGSGGLTVGTSGTGVGGVGATLASETWTGANGAVWPAQWTKEAAGATGSATAIQSNAGQLTYPTVSNYAVGDRWALTGMTAVGDADFTMTVTFPQIQEEYLQIVLRADAAGSRGYGINLYPGNGTATCGIIRWDSSGATGLVNNITGGAWAAGVPRKVRVRLVGNNIAIKVWDASTTEPAAWTSGTADDMWAGYTGVLSMQTITGSTTSGGTVSVDDLSVYAPTYTGTPGLVGTAALSGAGSLAGGTRTPALTRAVALSGAGALGGSGKPAPVGSGALAGAGALALASQLIGGSTSGTGTLTTSTGTPQAAVTVATSGTGALGAGARARVNLIANPSANRNTTGWSSTQSTAPGTLTRLTGLTGLPFTTAVDWSQTATTRTWSVYMVAVPAGALRAGNTYTLSFFARAISAPFTTSNVELCDSSGSNVVGSGMGTVALTASWQRYFFTFTAQRDSLSSTQVYVPVPTSSALEFQLGGVLIEAGGAATTSWPYFDGDSASTNTDVYGWSGTAGASSSQDYSANAIPALTSIAALSGAGGLYAPDGAVAWSLSGAGAVTVAAGPAFATAVGSTGAGTLAAPSSYATFAAVFAPSASGTLSVNALVGPIAGAPYNYPALTGAGALAFTTGVYGFLQTPALAGAGALSIARTVGAAQAVSLAGAGTLTDVVRAALGGSATLAGSGALAPIGRANPIGHPALSGAGSLVGNGGPQITAIAPGYAVQLGGGGLLAFSAALAVARGSAALLGVGNVAVLGSYPTGSGKFGASMTTQLQGSGALAASAGTLLAHGVGTLAGSGALAGVLTPGVLVVAAFSAIGGLPRFGNDGSPTVAAVAALAGVGALASSALAGTSGEAALAGAGALAASGLPGAIRAVALTGGSSLLAGAPTVVRFVTPTLGGSGTLTVVAVPHPTVGLYYSLSGAGSLTSSGVYGFRPSVTLSGAGSLGAVASVASVAAGAPVTLSAVGALLVAQSVGEAGAGTLGGQGWLSGIAPIPAFPVRPALTGLGTLGGTQVGETTAGKAAGSGLGQLATVSAAALAGRAAATATGQLLELAGITASGTASAWMLGTLSIPKQSGVLTGADHPLWVEGPTATPDSPWVRPATPDLTAALIRDPLRARRNARAY